MNANSSAIAAASPRTPVVLHQMLVPGTPEILYIPRPLIRAFADQPRTVFDPAGINDLGESMLADTQLIPALAKRLNPPIGQFQFELIDGERRWQAAELKNIERFLILVVEGDITPDEQFVRSVVANFFREPLGLMDTAHAIDRFEKMGLSMAQIGKKMGNKSVTWAFQHHSMLRLAPEVQLLLGPPTPEKERLSFQNALQLVDSEPTEQIRLAAKIRDEQMPAVRSRHFILRETVKAGSRKLKAKARTEFHILARFIRNSNVQIEAALDHDPEVFKAVLESAKPSEITLLLKHLGDLISGFEMLDEEIRETAELPPREKKKKKNS